MIKFKVNSIILLAIISFFPTQCCATDAPKCSDVATVSTVQNMLLEAVGIKEELTNDWINKNLNLEFIRAISYDEKIKKYICEARLIPGEIDNYAIIINYISQINDNNQHIVLIKNLNRFESDSLVTGTTKALKKLHASDGSSNNLNAHDDTHQFIDPRSIKQPSIVEMKYWTSVEQKIKTIWLEKKEIINKIDKNLFAQVFITINNKGDIINVQFDKKSNNTNFDQLIENSINLASPMPSFPALMRQDSTTVSMKFSPDTLNIIR